MKIKKKHLKKIQKRMVKSAEKGENNFVNNLVILKYTAGQLGLFTTMQALDKAVNAVGFELADKRKKK